MRWLLQNLSSAELTEWQEYMKIRAEEMEQAAAQRRAKRNLH